MTSRAARWLPPLLVLILAMTMSGCGPRASVDPAPYEPLVADTMTTLESLLPGVGWQPLDKPHWLDPRGRCWVQLGRTGHNDAEPWDYDARRVVAELNRVLQRHDFQQQSDPRWSGGRLVVESRDGSDVQWSVDLALDDVLVLVRVPASRDVCG